MAGRENIFNKAMNEGHSAAWDQKWDQAATAYQNALEEFPDHPKALTSLGLALFELQRYKSRSWFIRRRLWQHPMTRYPWRKWGNSQSSLGIIRKPSGHF